MIKISSIILLLTCINLRTAAQFDFEKQLNKPIYTADIIDPVYGILLYEPLNMFTRSDSSRMEGGYAINGWKEDHYSDGQLLHKGYYIEGQLKVYKNYYPNGNLERNFKSIDGFRSKAILYFENGNLKSEAINEDLISSYLSTANYPDPELLIRTSGENRVSNFLMWQLAYTELYFTSTLWPDFKKEHFYKAIQDFQSRERRFGKTSEQIQN